MYRVFREWESELHNKAERYELQFAVWEVDIKNQNPFDNHLQKAILRRDSIVQFTGINNVELLLKLRKDVTDLTNEEHSYCLEVYTPWVS